MTNLERELYVALKMARSQVKDLRIIIDEAKDMWRTLFVCGSTYDQSQVDAAIAHYESTKRDCTTCQYGPGQSLHSQSICGDRSCNNLNGFTGWQGIGKS